MVLVAASNSANNERDGRRNAFLSPSDIHILVVDDDKLSRAIVASLLRKCSYTGACRWWWVVECTPHWPQ